MRFQRRGGKRIVAPDGSEIARTSKPQPAGTLVKALARAYRWQRVLESGEWRRLAMGAELELGGYSMVSEIGEAENIRSAGSAKCFV